MNWKVNSLYITLMTIVTFVVWSATAGFFFSLTKVDVAQGDTGATTDAAAAGASAFLLALVCFVTVLSSAWFINRTRLSGKSLATQIFIMFFGTMFFMSQIETLFFGDAVAIPMPALAATLGSGFLVVLALSGQAVMFRASLGAIIKTPPINVSNRLAKFAALSLVYLAIYFLFGYFIAWQIPELRQYYSGSNDILPFIDHMKSVLNNDSWLPIFQLVRGVLWAAIAYTIAINTRNIAILERCLLVAVMLSAPLAIQLLIPNPYMPVTIRMGHFYEVLSSQFLFGLIAGWLFRSNKESR